MPETLPGSPLGLYRSGITGSLHRRSITVGREWIVQDTLEILRKAIRRKPKHHFLFIGPRGIGKTHLLSLFEDAVHEQSDLCDAYHVVRFPEESHRLLSFSNFLLMLCEILRDTLPDEPQWAELHARLSTEERDEIIVDTLVPAIRQRRRERGQSLIIMLENLNQIFEQQLRDGRHVASLRGFFMEDNGCLLIATAPLHFGAIADHKQPFYDFFDVQFLDQLSAEQTFELIRKNLEWEHRDDLLDDFDNLRPKLMALYRMTGGSPRLTLMLYELIAHDAVSEVKLQFQILLDRITPFYQDRMRDLSPQERALLETMASLRDQEKTPSAIAARMRMSTAQVSSLLTRLSKAQYLKSMENPRDKRSRLYAIREGFFDIWLAMNIHRTTRQRMPFLVEFFAEFYPSIEARNRKRAEYRQRLADREFETLPATPARSNLLDGLDCLSEVGTEEERAAEKLRLAAWHARDRNGPQTERYLQEVRRLPLEGMGRWIVANSGGEPSADYLTEIEELITCWETFRSGNLEAFAERLKATGQDLSYRSWSEIKISFLKDHLTLLPEARDGVAIRLRLGGVLRELARWSEAESELRAAVEEATELADSVLLSGSLHQLALLLLDINHMTEAEPLFRRALAIDEQRFGPDDATVAIALNNLAQLLQDTNRLAEAEPLLRRALAINEQSFGPQHPNVAMSLNNLAHLLQATARLAEAEPLMRRALAIDEHNREPDHPIVAVRLNNLAHLLKVAYRLDEAEPLLRRALAINEPSFGPNHPNVAICLNNLAQLLQAKNRLNEAEPLMRRALAIGEQSFGSHHPTVAVYINNLARLLQASGRLAEAELLMRRQLTILFHFSHATHHPHPHLEAGIGNYRELAEALGRSAEEIARELVEMAKEAQCPEKLVEDCL